MGEIEQTQSKSHEVGDTVFFMRRNKIVSGEIEDITEDDFETPVYIVQGEGMYSELIFSDIDSLLSHLRTQFETSAL